MGAQAARRSLIVIIFVIALPIFLPAQEGTLFKVENPDNTRSQIVVIAEEYLGTPYRYGGASKSGVDCSGLLYAVYNEAISVVLPRTAAAMYSYGIEIEREDLRAGDAVFFNTTGGISHVGLYIGGNRIIHAASAGPKTGVITSSLSERYYQSRIVGARQLLPAGQLEDKETETSLLDRVAGTWRGDKGIDEIIIEGNGSGEAVLANGVSMALRFTEEYGQIIAEQDEPNRAELYTSIVTPEIAVQLVDAARPQRWVFDLSANGGILKGVKETTYFSVDFGKLVSVDNEWSRDAIWERIE
jgi:hypothetical protein